MRLTKFVRSILVLAIALFASVLTVYGKNVQIRLGDMARVPDIFQMVTVENETPAYSYLPNKALQDVGVPPMKTSLLKGNNHCGIEFHGRMTVVKVGGSSLLVSYQAPFNQETPACPTGVLFRITKSEFVKMNKQYTEITARLENRQARVKRAEQNIVASKTKKQTPGHRWVKIENYVNNINVSFGPGYTCSISSEGFVEPIGREGNQTLVRYTLNEKTGGACCPSGVLFFVDTEDVNKWPDYSVLLSFWQKSKLMFLKYCFR